MDAGYVVDTTPHAVPFRPIYGWQHIDTLIADCLSQPDLDTFMRYWALGDGAGTFTLYTSRGRHTSVLLDPSDGGEYGYDNSFFFLRGDSIIAFRRFDKSIELPSSDNARPTYRLREEIYYFDSPGPRAYHRERLTQNSEDSTVNEVPFKSMVADTGHIYQQLKENYEGALQRRYEP